MKILIGSNNKNKIKDWKEKLKDFNLVSPTEIGIDIDVDEGLVSLEENALKKAREFFNKSGTTTISEDTGFFIEELNGEPGVAVKRWGGQLPENVSNEDFISYLKNKINGLINPKAYFKTVVGIIFSNTEEKTISIKINGFIDTKLLNNLKEFEGFPLGHVFINEGSNKTWNGMAFEEQEDLYKEMYNGVRKILLEHINS